MTFTGTIKHAHFLSLCPCVVHAACSVCFGSKENPSQFWLFNGRKTWPNPINLIRVYFTTTYILHKNIYGAFLGYTSFDSLKGFKFIRIHYGSEICMIFLSVTYIMALEVWHCNLVWVIFFCNYMKWIIFVNIFYFDLFKKIIRQR